MKNLLEWKIAFKNLFRNKWRTIATLSAVMTGFCGLGLLGGYIIRTENYLRVNTVYINHNGHFSIFTKDGIDMFARDPKKYQINKNDIRRVIEILNKEKYKKEIEFYAQYVDVVGLISNGENSFPYLAKGIEPEVSNRIMYHPEVIKWTKELAMQEQGVDFSQAVKENPHAISITKSLGILLGIEAPFLSLAKEKREFQLLGQTVEGGINAYDAEVKIMHNTGYLLAEDTGLIAPLNFLQELYDFEGVSHFSVYLKKNPFFKSPLVEELNREFAEEGLNLEAISYKDDRLSQFYVGTMSFLVITSFFFVILICSAVVISVVNAMTMGIIERAREIGTMRSFGFDKKTIEHLFLKESLLLCSIGSFLGLILTQAIAFFVNSLNIRFSPPGINGDMQLVLSPDLWFCFVSFVLITFLGALTGLYVSRKKLKVKIIELLTS